MAIIGKCIKHRKIMTAIKNIKIRDFRNLIKVDCRFNSGYNLLIGENGHGKTNMLEAIYYLSLLRSFRTASINELKNWESRDKLFFISATTDENDGSRQLSVSYGQKRAVKINGMPLTRTSDYIGELVCIVFSPEDIEMITGTGKVRRRFLDIALSQLSKRYLQALQAYKHILKNRNNLLKQRTDNSKIIASFDKQLIDYGVIIHAERVQFFEKLKTLLQQKSERFYNGEKDFDIEFSSNTALLQFESEEELKETFMENLRNSMAKDLERGMSHCGPHRDDFVVILQGKKLRSFGSRGQCRLASLLLRLCSSEIFLEGGRGEEVIFLVDDVTGELDDSVKNSFFTLLEKGTQVFFAATEIPEVLKNKNDINIFSVNNGEIERVEK